MRKLSHRELLARQSRQSAGQRLPISVILNNIRSLYNVGSIFRTADGVGVEKIWLCGITGVPGEVRRGRVRLEKTALGAEKAVPWEYRESAVSVIRELKTKGYQLILVEQIEESVPYDQFEPTAPVGLILGNEITGIEEEILPLCDGAIEIPMAGLKNSLNVTVAFGIVAYHVAGRIGAMAKK